MSIYRPQKTQPKNGHTVVVLNPARISGCESQKDESLDDQQELIIKTLILLRFAAADALSLIHI